MQVSLFPPPPLISLPLTSKKEIEAEKSRQKEGKEQRHEESKGVTEKSKETRWEGNEEVIKRKTESEKEEQNDGRREEEMWKGRKKHWKKEVKELIAMNPS